jgi:hypothetical protein
MHAAGRFTIRHSAHGTVLVRAGLLQRTFLSASIAYSTHFLCESAQRHNNRHEVVDSIDARKYSFRIDG